jgi:YfiR/HmsC-like
MAVTVVRRAIVCLLLVVFGIARPSALSQRNLEYEVKGAYLYNFLTFVEWPTAAFPDATAPFRLCVLGTDPFGRSLDALVQNEKVQGHSVIVERLKDETAAGTCHVVFAPDASAGRFPALVKATEHKSVLLVGESRKLLELCGAIAFVVEGERVRFDISLPGLSSHNLKASSKLLRVARETSDKFAHCTQ